MKLSGDFKIDEHRVRTVIAASSDPGYISVTEWPDGEGYDIEVNLGYGSNAWGHIWVTEAQWRLLKKLMKRMLKRAEAPNESTSSGDS